ncbi:15059_t:CDS:2, partial [Gigaspora rosea]
MKENKEKYQIYATALHTEENICGVFSVHIEYIFPGNPCLVIQCVKKRETIKFPFSRSRKYKVKVAWMIVGFYSNFNFKPSLLKLKSFTLPNPRQKFYYNHEYNDSNENTDENFSELLKFHNTRTYCLLGLAHFGIKMHGKCWGERKNPIYKGEKWAKAAKEDERIFASLLYEKNNRVNQCSPVFVNINPKRPILLSFNEQDKKIHTFLTC